MQRRLDAEWPYAAALSLRSEPATTLLVQTSQTPSRFIACRDPFSWGM
jgi:hypothetical protein